jgi:hypothetical protein
MLGDEDEQVYRAAIKLPIQTNAPWWLCAENYPTMGNIPSETPLCIKADKREVGTIQGIKCCI